MIVSKLLITNARLINENSIRDADVLRDGERIERVDASIAAPADARVIAATNRDLEEMITAGRVAVNGVVVTELGTKVVPGTDRVAVDGRPVRDDGERIYIALHKPAGYVTSCRQPGDRTILELVDIAERVYPVGRLDKASTGLLLLTNDGRIHHRLSHPSFDHEKEYEVKVDRPMSDAALSKMAAGMPVLGSRTRKAAVKRLSGRRFRIVLKEGKPPDPPDGAQAWPDGGAPEADPGGRHPVGAACRGTVASPDTQRNPVSAR